MSGVDLQLVCEAFKTVLDANKPSDRRDYTVFAWPPLGRTGTCVWVAPDYTGDFFDPWPTIGDTYSDAADLFVTLELDVPPADAKSLGIALAAYLSIGTGQSSSIIGALLTNPTLGGVVERVVPGAWRVQDPGDDGPPVRASLPVAVYLRKS